MRPFRLAGALQALLSAALFITSPLARAMTIDVPADQPTLQAAVGAVALSADVDNVITISVSPVTTNTTISLGPAFSAGRRLVIRPAAAHSRASVVNMNPSVAIFDMSSAGFVTLQDLDILRNISNDHHLVQMTLCEEIVIERCRIGSNWTSPGTPGWANVYIAYPTGIVLRNNILFSKTPGTFDRGIDAMSFNDPANSLRLYNNDVTSHKEYGIRIEAAVAGALVLLRNNVVANDASLIPEPTAYRTEVGMGPTVVTSHNVAYATGALVQSGLGQDIAGLPSQFLVFAKGDVVPSFKTVTWDNTMLDANPDFFRLLDLGPVHDAPGDYGMTVATVAPDIAVVDDVEQDYRPGGVPQHSDRGADQLEPGTNPAAVDLLVGAGSLVAVAQDNPSRSVRIAWASQLGGRLAFEVFDAAGRRLHSEERSIGAESRGSFEWRDPAHAGITFYRLRLKHLDGGLEEVAGRVAIVR